VSFSTPDPTDATMINEVANTATDTAASSGVAIPTVPHIVVPTRRGSRTRVLVALGAIVCALGFVVFKGLGDASQFYRPADQALAQRESLGTKRFSLIGVVLDGTVVEKGRQVSFTIEQNGAQLAVLHTGVPPELFRPGMPVLLDGHFESTTGNPVFLSDRMAVKHSADYKSENPDRVDASAP
jgi:cytochrome c-type biogenesis protein CcmE